uniref:PUM-HD domain-containing protein n=1 Tax=Panagrolaimus sp. PS1159 TaxID=55785 RepID=A0AC35FFP8_9BILA
MVVKRVKAGKPKRVVKKTVVKKAPKEVDDSKKRVSFAKKLTHSKIIEEDVNVSQNFDVTPSKGILKTRKRVADAEPETRPPAKTKPQTSDKENRIPRQESDEPQLTKKKPIQKFPKAAGKKKLVVKKSVKEKLLAMNPKERKAFLRELKAKSNPNFELASELKVHWEKLRSSKTPENVKEECIEKLCSLIKGNAVKLIFAHDTSRIFECLLALKRDNIRDMLFNELQPEIIKMSKSKYARYFVLRMLKYGTAEQRVRVFNAFEGHYPSIYRTSWSASVLETAYSDYASCTKRNEIVCEFYGKEFAFLKKTGAAVPTIQTIKALDKQRQNEVATNLYENLETAVGKEHINHSLTHRLLSDFFTIANKEQRGEMIDLLKDRVPQFCHTRDGSRAAQYCVWYGNVKERKVIVKSFKDLVVNTVKDEFAHRVILSIFDTVDDTTLVNKYITKEIGNYIGDVVVEKFGQWVLHYIVHPRDYRFFHNSTVELLKQGDGNEHTKKPASERYREIFDALKKPLLTYIAANMEELLFNKMTSTLVLNILEPEVEKEPFKRVIDDEDKIACFKAIAEVVGKEFIPFNLETDPHIIEGGCARFSFMNLLKRDHLQGNIKLSDYLAELPSDHLGSFIAINNGCFVLRNMVKSGSEKAKIAVTKAANLKTLKKSPHIGAKHLMEELNLK